MDRPIPAFYCVYLLRSTVSKLAHVYVGSTPNPKRRLRQHNGEIQGGATKTSWDRNRPWEMAVMVTGFPSKIAALQFEWSWQNTYKTRHVDGQDREELHSKDKLPSSGKAPAATLRRRLKDLHTLLRANSFARWPLDVRFFSPEAYTHWQTKVVPSTSYQLPQYTSVAFVGGDSTGLGPEMDTSTTNVTGINAIDVSYRSMLPHVAKCQAHLRATSKIQCAICNVQMHPDKDLVAFCTRSTCTTASHLTCLPSLFSHGTVAQSPLLPVNGTCPTCNSPLSWTTVAKETSLRARGRAEIDKLLKPARIKKASASTHGPASTALGREDSDAESEDSLVVRDDIMAGPVMEEQTALPINNGSLAHHSPTRSHDPLAAVIPDSDWDDIEEVLT